MHYQLYFVHVMEWEDIKTIVPAEAAAFETLLTIAGIPVAGTCRALAEESYWEDLTFAVDNYDAIEALIDDIEDAWEKLAESFAKATLVDGAGLYVKPRIEYELAPYHGGWPFAGQSCGSQSGGVPAYFAVRGAFRVIPPGEASAVAGAGLTVEPFLDSEGEEEPAGFMVRGEYCTTPPGEAFADKIRLRVFGM